MKTNVGSSSTEQAPKSHSTHSSHEQASSESRQPDSLIPSTLQSVATVAPTTVTGPSTVWLDTLSVEDRKLALATGCNTAPALENEKKKLADRLKKSAFDLAAEQEAEWCTISRKTEKRRNQQLTNMPRAWLHGFGPSYARDN